MKVKSIEPHLRVLECLDDTAPSKLLVSNSIAIPLESGDDVFLLLGSQEPGSRRVVVDEEICGNGNYNGQKPSFQGTSAFVRIIVIENLR